MIPNVVPEDFSSMEYLRSVKFDDAKNGYYVAHYGKVPSGTRASPPLLFLIHLGRLAAKEIHKLTDGDVCVTFDQFTVEKMRPGVGFFPITDSQVFGEYVCMFVFGGGVTIEFTKGIKKLPGIYVKPNSLVVLSGEARYILKRSIGDRKFDMVDGVKTQRTTTYIVTMRVAQF